MSNELILADELPELKRLAAVVLRRQITDVSTRRPADLRRNLPPRPCSRQPGEMGANMSTLTRRNIYQPRIEPIFIPGRKFRRAAVACRFCLVVRRSRSGRAIS